MALFSNEQPRNYIFLFLIIFFFLTYYVFLIYTLDATNVQLDVYWMHASMYACVCRLHTMYICVCKILYVKSASFFVP